jgi:hypothetical protein
VCWAQVAEVDFHHLDKADSLKVVVVVVAVLVDYPQEQYRLPLEKH